MRKTTQGNPVFITGLDLQCYFIILCVDVLINIWKGGKQLHGLAFAITYISKYIMAIWVVEFSNGEYKIRKIFA